MSDTLVAQADLRLEEALQKAGARDPREFYRERLRALKDDDTAAYEEAVRYYRETLIPSVAGGNHDPLDAWTEYGRRLTAAVAPGRTVMVDVTGRASPYEGPTREHLILQIPDEKKGRALLVGLPPALSAAQKATYDVLVSGKQRRQP